MMSLSAKQTEVLEFIEGFHRSNRYGPTYREIRDHFGYSSINAAVVHVNALIRKGYLRKDGGQARGLIPARIDPADQSRVVGLPVLGRIAAGFPDGETDGCCGTLSVDTALLGGSKGRCCYVLRVDGDSMIGRGFQPGDWVIVDAELDPRDGDVVVALIDGESTLKTLCARNSNKYLRAENPRYGELLPVSDLEIQGVVVAAMRRVR